MAHVNSSIVNMGKVWYGPDFLVWFYPRVQLKLLLGGYHQRCASVHRHTVHTLCFCYIKYGRSIRLYNHSFNVTKMPYHHCLTFTADFGFVRSGRVRVSWGFLSSGWSSKWKPKTRPETLLSTRWHHLHFEDSLQRSHDAVGFSDTPPATNSTIVFIFSIHSYERSAVIFARILFLV